LDAIPASLLPPLENVWFVRVEDTAPLASSGQRNLRKFLCSHETPNDLPAQFQPSSDFADAYSLPRERSYIFIACIALRSSSLPLQFGVTYPWRSLIRSRRNRSIVFLCSCRAVSKSEGLAFSNCVKPNCFN